MKVRISHKIMVAQRVQQLRTQVQYDTQKIRLETLESLKTIFSQASSIARGDFKTQNDAGKPVKVTLKQRQMWARVTAYTAQIINGIAEGYDARQIDLDLARLQEMIIEAEAKINAAGAGEGPKTPVQNSAPSG